jgi:hypothetical protein
MSQTLVRVFIPDPAHGEEPESKEFRHGLEAEYGERFRFMSIGTGAALASYFVELAADPYRAAAIAAAVFFTGKAIREGFEAWGWMYSQISRFFHHDPTFNREGAAFVVYEAIVEKIGGAPNSFQLRGFVTQHRLAYGDPMNLPDPGLLTNIEADRDRVERADVYVFQVEADCREFRVEVDGHRVKFLHAKPR